ncbi:extracellular solute-binding protein [Oceaniglobus ichthyenteri]|uniref:extracellular solute-binding protein n=1 Tax=Oceaniglobus ichthyenteri TaxID=2136177 RepID=UPI000D3B4BFF|nr:extracellular solute-binding protein [Oceaniglobus ichthyenteri]
MPHRTAPQAIAVFATAQWRDLRMKWAGALLLGAGLALGGASAKAQSDDVKIIKAHGYSDLGGMKYGPDFERLEYVNPDAPKGGEIATWARGTFDSMNAYSRKGRAHGFSVVPYESIMTSTADDPYGAYCLLCETLEYPETQEWVIFNLRPEARFSDGTPLTAEDVAFSHRLSIEQGLPSFAAAVKALIPEVEVLGPHRVKFIFNPDVPRKGLIGQAGAATVFQKKWYEETGARLDESRLETSPGSGPYVVDEVEVNRRITLKRNPEYWGADLPINIGRHNFDTMRVEFFADSNAALEGFKAGAYTFRQETSSLTWATQYDFPAVARGTIVKTELANGVLPPATGFVFNLRLDKFKDVRVRRALGMMFNFTWTNDTLQYGLFAHRTSFWENSPLAATGLPEGRELDYLQSLGDAIDPTILTTDVPVPDPGGSRQLDRGNLRAALALLQEAGYSPGDDGVLRRDGVALSVELLESNPSFDRIFIPYVDNLKRLGVDAKYNRIDDAQYTARNRDGDFDMIYDFYRNGLEEGLGISQRFGCEDALNSVFNPAAYCDPAVDKLIEAVIKAESLEDMQAAVRAIDRILRHAYFMVPTWYNDSYWVAYYDMFEHPETLPPYDLGHLDFWWYNADKAAALRASGAL